MTGEMPSPMLSLKRCRLIYKGTASTPDTSRIDYMYLGQYVDANLGIPTDDFVFPLSGNPVLGTGDLDGRVLPPGDRRFFASSGPFSMALGDTIEITVALVGGLGSDRLLSISAMKYYDRAAQQAFDNLFVMPTPPPQPAVTATGLDRQILLK